MNCKMYTEEQKEVFKTPKDWAISSLREHCIAKMEGSIEELNENFIYDLTKVRTWEDVEDIANRYII